MIKRVIIWAFIIFFLSMGVYSIMFIDDTIGEFNQGEYVNTTHNNSGIVLEKYNVSGTYTSRIFDAGSKAKWGNLEWHSSIPQKKFLYAVDGGGDVYYSDDGGVTWQLKKENYGRTTDTQEMFSDEDYLYIITKLNKEVWRSNDSGASWGIIAEDFADSSLRVGEAGDSKLYIADGSGDVYVSSDNGASWTKKGDFNGGSIANAKGMGINSTGSIFIVDGNKEVYVSSDNAETWTQQTDDYGGNAYTDDLEVDSSENLYILKDKEVYKSTDNGVTWTKICDSFTPYNTYGCKMLIDSEDNFYIADCNGRIFESTDGINWQEKGDINGGATNDIKGITEFTQSTEIKFQVRNCSLADCSDASFVGPDGTTSSYYTNLTYINKTSRYFQYKVYFLTQSPNITPILYNVTIEYSLLNRPPRVDSLNISPANPKTNDDLTCSFIITDADAGDSLTVNITWYKNGVKYYSGSQPVTNGTLANSILDSSNTGKNEEWNCSIIPYDGKSYGNENSSAVNIQNSPPTAPDISITPSLPKTTNDLNVIFNSVSEDADNDAITYTYKWYRDGILQPSLTTSTVSSDLTSKNQVWEVVVIPNDGEEDGNSSEYNVTIQNSIPSISAAFITPTVVYENTTLEVNTGGWNDDDNEPEQYTYQWFNQNGKIEGATSSTLNGEYFNKSDQIYCNVTPYDSDDYGASKLTNTVTILNSLPTLTVNLSSELGFNGMDEDLIGSFVYNDADNDEIAENQTKWYKNGIEQTNLNGLTRISYTNTSAGDIWIFSVRANDGESWSNWFNSSPLTILDISQTHPVLISPENGTYFNESNVLFTYTTPNYENMNCTIFSDETSNPTTPIKTTTNIQSKTTVICNWKDIADNQYYWKVGCTNDSILFNSTIKTFTIDTTFPTTAPNLTASDFDYDGNIELNWTQDPDAYLYNIYRSLSEIIDATDLTPIASVSSTYWEDNSTLQGITYWYAITVVDRAGNENKSVVSNSANATANDTIKPRLPNYVNATSLNGVTTLYWNKVTMDTSNNSDEFGLRYKIWYALTQTANLSKQLVNETADYIKTVSQNSCSGSLCHTTHELSSSYIYHYFITTIDDNNNENLSIINNYANLTATTRPPSSGGGGGGSGGGSSSREDITIKKTKKEECTEKWSCSEWYSCVNNVQARTCVDINHCGTEKNKPPETRPCSLCVEDWECSEWSPCSKDNIQTRICKDKNNCGTEKNKPEEEKACSYEMCNNGIQDQGEEGIDCGGPCFPCGLDKITGKAITVLPTKKPNPYFMVPSLLLLVLFIATINIRKTSLPIKNQKIIMALHVSLVVVIISLFALSFIHKQSPLKSSNKLEIKQSVEGIEKNKEGITTISGLNTLTNNFQRNNIATPILGFVILIIVILIYVRKIRPKHRAKYRTKTIKQRIEHYETKKEEVSKTTTKKPPATPATRLEASKKPKKEEIINHLRKIYNL